MSTTSRVQSRTTATPLAVTKLNTSTSTPLRSFTSGITSYAEPAKLLTTSQQAAQMAQQIKPVMTMPSATGGMKSGGSSTPVHPAAVIAAAAAAAASNTGITSGGGGGGGGGGDEPQQQSDDGAAQYDDPGPQYDASGGYSDPTWDAATTPVPAPTGAIVAPSTLPTSVPSTVSAAIVPASKTTVQPKTFWQKLLSLFGFGASIESPAVLDAAAAAKPAVAAAAVHGDPNSVEEVAASLVRRSRLGDQNATAMLCEIRDNAKRGNAKAVRSQKLIMAYIDANPVRDDVDVGEELRITVEHADMKTVIEHGVPCDRVLATAVSLSHGPPLTDKSIGKYMTRFGAEMQRAMAHGMLNPRVVPHPDLKQHLKDAHEVGRTIGAARRLQAVRGGAAFSALDPVIGWEVGE